MIAVDTSTWIAYFEGDSKKDCQALDAALAASQVMMPNTVLAELLSEPKLKGSLKRSLLAIPRLSEGADFWVRVGELRAKIIAKSRRAKLADSLIAQSCIDNHIALLTRDTDFRVFAKFASLSLIERIVI